MVLRERTRAFGRLWDGAGAMRAVSTGGAPCGILYAMSRLAAVGVTVVFALLPGQAAASARFFGFNDNAPLTHDLTIEQDANLLASAGANSARITLDWTWVEHAEGTLDLRLYDPIYAAWLSRGIRPVLILTGSPRWAWPPWWTWPDLDYCFNGEPCHVPPDPSKDGDWAHFAAEVAKRYPAAAAIEVWNEPNVRGFFATGPDPVRYTQLLRLAHGAIKKVNPSMPVLGGSLASVLSDQRETEGYGIEPFLYDMYRAGARGLMDGLSIHAYPHQGLAADVLAAVGAARRLRHGVPLWITEVGASTTGSTDPDTSGGYDDARQAALLGLVVRALIGMPDVAAVYIHTLADPRAIPPESPERGFGLLRSPSDEKPAFRVVSRIFRTARRAAAR